MRASYSLEQGVHKEVFPNSQADHKDLGSVHCYHYNHFFHAPAYSPEGSPAYSPEVDPADFPEVDPADFPEVDPVYAPEVSFPLLVYLFSNHFWHKHHQAGAAG